MTSRRTMTMLAATGALALAVAACGGDGDDGGGDTTDLTTFAPADAPLFVEGAIRPEGEVKDSIDAILDRFPNGEDVGSRLIDEINKSAEEDGSGFNYEDDLEPWLGERAAFYAAGFKQGAPPSFGESQTEVSEGALIVETTDEDEARQKIRELAEEDSPVTEQEYNGVSYQLSQDRGQGGVAGVGAGAGVFTAAAVFDGVAVIGTERGIKDAIDARAGESLSNQAEYAEFRQQRGSDLLISAYADIEGILDAVPAGAGFTEQEREAFRSAVGSFAEQPAMLGVEVTESQATIDFQGGSSPFAVTGASELLQAGFADAWAAAAVPDIGETLSSGFDQIASAGLPGSDLGEVNAMLQQQIGLSLDDIKGIGDAAFFAAGESIIELQVGGLVEVPDAAARDRLLSAIRTGVRRSGEGKVRPLQVEGAEDGFSIQLPQLPVPINVAAAGDRVAIGAGPAASTLLSGEGGLADSDGYKQATEALGEDVSLAFLVEMQPIVELVESTGEDDADFRETKPYLEAFDLFAVGSQRSGDVDTSRTVVRFSD